MKRNYCEQMYNGGQHFFGKNDKENSKYDLLKNLYFILATYSLSLTLFTC